MAARCGGLRQRRIRTRSGLSRPTWTRAVTSCPYQQSAEWPLPLSHVVKSQTGSLPRRLAQRVVHVERFSYR